MRRGYKVTLEVIILLSMIVNFMAASNVRENNKVENEQVDVPKTASPSTYIIVTTNAIELGSDNLTDFVDYKESLGFTVEVITENNYTGIGHARVLSIRQWLIDNYEAKKIQYVLLIGNPDPDDNNDGGDSYGDIPMLYCWPRRGAIDGYEEAPTDYIYADLTGNWDSDSDTYFGEHGDDTGVDFDAEVYVGRIPFYGPPYSDLDNILIRIINHHNDTGTEKNKILLPMAISNYENEDGQPMSRTDGLDCPEYVWDYIANPEGMSDTVMYEGAGVLGSEVPDTAFHYDMDLTKTNFINELNDDYGAVFWWAHGSDTGASRRYWSTDGGNGEPEAAEMTLIDFIESGDMDSLENDKPAFFFQSSCLNGKPEVSDNLGYALLKKGAAISTVSASRVSWYKVGNWSPLQNYADNTAIGYVYMNYLIEEKMTSGKALFDAKDIFWDDWGAESWMNKMDFNLYGDPALYYWYESPPASSGGLPVSGGGGGGGSDDYDLDTVTIFIIAAVIIGAGVGITIIVVSVVRKKGDLAGRDMIPPYIPPPTTPTAPITPAESPQIQTISGLSPIPQICTKCGAALKMGIKFCTTCGEKIIK